MLKMPLISTLSLNCLSLSKITGLFPVSSKSNNPCEQGVLSYAVNSSSKKDMDKRQEQIWDIIGQEVYEILIHEDILYKLLVDNNLGSLLLDLICFYISFMEQLREKQNFNYLESITNAITNLLVKDFQMLKHTISHTVMADKVGNFNINRLIKRIFLRF